MEIFYQTRRSLRFVDVPKDDQYAYLTSYLLYTVVFFVVIVSALIALFRYMLVEAKDVQDVSQCIYMALVLLTTLCQLLILFFQRFQFIKFIDLVGTVINKR